MTRVEISDRVERDMPDERVRMVPEQTSDPQEPYIFAAQRGDPDLEGDILRLETDYDMQFPAMDKPYTCAE